MYLIPLISKTRSPAFIVDLAEGTAETNNERMGSHVEASSPKLNVQVVVSRPGRSIFKEDTKREVGRE